MLSLHSANLASPNWPQLPDWYGQKADVLLSLAVLFRNKRSLRRNAAWLDLLRTAPSRGRTAQCSCLAQGETLVVCSMKNCSDDGTLSLWTMIMIRERSSIVPRHISRSESEALLWFNKKSNLSVTDLTQNRHAEITYVMTRNTNSLERRIQKKSVTQRICWNADHDSDAVNSRVMYNIYLRQLNQNNVLVRC